MARPSKYDWADIKKHYEAGMSQPEIVAEFKCPKSSLSERVKKEGWVINELAVSTVKGKIEVSERVSELNRHDVRLSEIVDKIVDRKTRHTDLVYSLQEKALNKASTMLEQLDTPNELKTVIEAVDKASITLKVSDRHAPKIDVQQLQQNNTTPTVVNIVEDKVSE